MDGSVGTEVKFGRRARSQPAGLSIRAEDIRRGVAALNTLARADLRDPLARASCLYYALRSYTGGAPIDPLVSAVNARIAAFEQLIGSRPRLIARENASAALEAAVYEVVASEPIIETMNGPRFDFESFAARLPGTSGEPVGARRSASELGGPGSVAVGAD